MDKNKTSERAAHEKQTQILNFLRKAHITYQKHPNDILPHSVKAKKIWIIEI